MAVCTGWALQPGFVGWAWLPPLPTKSTASGKARMAGVGCVHVRLGSSSATAKSPVLDLPTA